MSRHSWNDINLRTSVPDVEILLEIWESHTESYFLTSLTTWKTTATNPDWTFLFTQVLSLSNRVSRKSHKFPWRPQYGPFPTPFFCIRLEVVGLCFQGKHLLRRIYSDASGGRIQERLMLVQYHPACSIRLPLSWRMSVMLSKTRCVFPTYPTIHPALQQLCLVQVLRGWGTCVLAFSEGFHLS